MLSYDVVDVFTDRAFAGNPLAVVHGADALDDAQLLAIAREFNLSETTFPAAVEDGGTGYPVRIFTPGGEIPFAGHPTLGTAWVLQQHGLLPAGTVVQHCGAGDIGVRLPDEPAGQVRLRATPRELGEPLDAVAVAATLGLSPEDVAGEARIAGCNQGRLTMSRAAGMRRCALLFRKIAHARGHARTSVRSASHGRQPGRDHQGRARVRAAGLRAGSERSVARICSPAGSRSTGVRWTTWSRSSIPWW